MFTVRGKDLLEHGKYPSAKGMTGGKPSYSFNGQEYMEYLSLRGTEKDFVRVEGDAIGIRAFYQFMLWFMVNKKIAIGSSVYGVDRNDVDKNGNNRGLRKWKNVLCVDAIDEETKCLINGADNNSGKYAVDKDGDLCVYVGGNLLQDNRAFAKMFMALSEKQDISEYILCFGGSAVDERDVAKQSVSKTAAAVQASYISYYNYNGTANSGCQCGSEFLTNECVREYKGNLYFMMPHSVITGERADDKSFVIAQMKLGERRIRELKTVEGGIWVNHCYSGFSVFDDSIYFVKESNVGSYTLTTMNLETKEETSQDITQRLEKSGWQVEFVSYPVKNRNGEILYIVTYQNRNDANQIETFLVGEYRSLELGSGFISAESAYNEQYLYAKTDNGWKSIDLTTLEATDLDKKLKRIRYIDARKDLFYVEGDKGQLLAMDMSGEKVGEISLPEVIMGGKKEEYKGYSYNSTSPSLVFNGEYQICLIPQATDDAGKRYGVIFFDRTGNEIRRYEWETKERDYTYNSELALCISGAVCLALEMEDIKTGEAAKWGSDTRNFRWKLDMLYPSASGVEREERVFGIFQL
ncbi:MAG: hypothetical protein NC124_09525 [Clostridium sp.]|nr:hypothetical protein [Clostridium sp.]